MDIRELCKRAGLTQKKLGAIVRVEQGTVGGWKHGVPAKHVSAISKATGIPPSEIRPDIFSTE